MRATRPGGAPLATVAGAVACLLLLAASAGVDARGLQAPPPARGAAAAAPAANAAAAAGGQAKCAAQCDKGYACMLVPGPDGT
jgi:hypothetical protein